MRVVGHLMACGMSYAVSPHCLLVVYQLRVTLSSEFGDPATAGFWAFPKIPTKESGDKKGGRMQGL